MQSFKREYKIIIPMNDNSGNYIPITSKQKYLSEIVNHFGGITVVPNTIGCYFSDKTKQVECDVNAIVYANRIFKDKNEILNHSQIQKDREFIRNLSKEIGKDYGQESVFTSEMKCNADLTECEWRPTWSGKIPQVQLIPLLERIRL